MTERQKDRKTEWQKDRETEIQKLIMFSTTLGVIDFNMYLLKDSIKNKLDRLTQGGGECQKKKF
jgi:hypothetical protein